MNKPKLIDTIGQFTTIPNTVIRLWPKIGEDAFQLFVYLRYRSNERDESWPSYDTIQKDTGIGRHRISAAIEKLEDFELLSRQKRFSNSTIYSLHLPKAPISAESALMDEQPLVPNQHSSSADSALPLVPNQHSNQTQLTRLNELETTGGRENPPNIFALYEQNIGMIMPLIAEELKDAESEYPAAWIPEAFKIAIQNNVRNWSYVKAILERWKVDGFGVDNRPKKNGKQSTNEPAGFAGIRAAMEELNGKRK